MHPILWKLPFVDYPIRSYGFMLMIGFFSAAYIAAKRAERVRANPDVVLNCAIFALIGSMIGARLFYVVHYWEQFALKDQPLKAIIDISRGGMELFGGIAGAMVVVLAYLLIRRDSIRMYLDILVPGLMWGLAFGRMGCFLNGCCWGGVCQGTVAEPWGVQFPYGSPAHVRQYEDRQVKVPAELLASVPPGRFFPIPHEQVFMSPEDWGKHARELERAQRDYDYVQKLDPDSESAKLARQKVEQSKKQAEKEEQEQAAINRSLRMYQSSEYPGQKITRSELEDLAKKSRSLKVHPTQLYATINAFFASFFLAWLFRVRRRHGIVFA
ncbi:MAG: prolipoprotein diacylglyceryl transferase, partial [Planctomycetes bacterium]|nr:prolipoprotein diacylglyceryl transferase [Planctomycetota bacterium]